MSALTREQIERMRKQCHSLFVNEGLVNALCDMALRSLAGESAIQDTNEPADAIEMARVFLREIVQRQPEVLKNHDVEAFVMNVLNPALVSARKFHRHIQSMQRIVEREAAAPAEATIIAPKDGRHHPAAFDVPAEAGEPNPCCGDYSMCHKPCTVRGAWLERAGVYKDIKFIRGEPLPPVSPSPEARDTIIVGNQDGLTPTGQYIADCERDAKRYQWLRAYARITAPYDAYVIQPMKSGLEDVIYGEELDDTIDAALRLDMNSGGKS